MKIPFLRPRPWNSLTSIFFYGSPMWSTRHVRFVWRRSSGVSKLRTLGWYTQMIDCTRLALTESWYCRTARKRLIPFKRRWSRCSSHCGSCWMAADYPPWQKTESDYWFGFLEGNIDLQRDMLRKRRKLVDIYRGFPIFKFIGVSFNVDNECLLFFKLFLVCISWINY